MITCGESCSGVWGRDSSLLIPLKNPIIDNLGQVLNAGCCPATRGMELRQEMIYLEPSRVRFKRQEI